MKKVSNLLWGLAFIIVGVIFGLNATGLTNIDVFFDGWWTLFIIVPCFIGLCSDHEKTGSIIGLIIGIALLLACQDVLDFDLIWKLTIPVILIIIGMSILFRESFGCRISEEINKLNRDNKEKNQYASTFAGQDINFDNETFTGAELTAVFGGIKCDLRKAKITKDVVINAEAIFGSVEILVPDDVKIKIKSTPIFGGTSNIVNNNVDAKAATIYINSTTVFGGVEVK